MSAVRCADPRPAAGSPASGGAPRGVDLARRVVLALTGAALVLSGVSPLRAQSASADGGASSTAGTSSTAGMDEEARAVFEAGRAAYANGRFESALEHFRRSYELSHRPALLYNIASASDRLDRDQEALTHYRRYLAEDPNIPDSVRAQVEARAEIIARRLERDAALQAERAREAERAAAEETPAPAPSPAPSGGGVDATAPIVLFTVAGVGLVAGVTSGALALSRQGELNDVCTDRSCPSSARGIATDMDRFALAADLSLGVSLLSAAVATTLWLVSAGSTPAASASSVTAPRAAGTWTCSGLRCQLSF